MKKSFSTRWFAAAFLAVGFIVSYGILAYAQTTTIQGANGNGGGTLQGITFPIPELGNCGSEEACRAYCNDTAHIDACISFAQAHGLMNKDEASQAEKFKQALESGGGPGGCTGPADCEAFCSNQTNLEVCVKFAKDHGVKDHNVDQGEKILAYLKSGGHMPGDCNSQTSCEAYCGDFSHAEECFNFAKNLGITQAGHGLGGSNHGGGNEPTPEQLQKFLELAKNGQTPGGCKSKDECEAYCKDQTHRDECVAFGVKAGFIKPEEADMIQKSGGNGPGGCNSNDSCSAYCNDQSHRDECYKFAEDHGFISHNETVQAQQGLVRVRAGFDQVPPEVVDCLKSSVGPNVIDDMQSGKLVPTPEIGQSIKACFEKFGAKSDPSESFKHVPPEVLACLKDKISADQFAQISSGKAMPTPEMADTVRVCFQSIQMQQMPGGQGGQGGEEHNGFTECGIVPGAVAVYVCGINGKGAPAGVETTYFNRCHAEQQGVQILHEGVCNKQDCPDIADPVCMNDGSSLTNDCHAEKYGGVKHKGVCTNEDRGQNGGPSQQNGSGGNFQNFLQTAPPEITACLEQALGADFDKLKSGALPADPSVYKKAQSCLSNFRPQNPGNGPGGPGGQACNENVPGCMEYCKKNPEQCKTPSEQWCQSNPGRCNGNSAGGGQSGPGFQGGQQGAGFGGPQTGPGPGGCSNPAECKAYCSDPAHQAECARFGAPGVDHICSAGTYWDYAASNCTPQKQCESDQCWDNATKTCVPGTQPCGQGIPSTTSCPSGQYWNGSSCMAPTGDPATTCSKSGGTWTGTTCQMPSSNTPPPPSPTTTPTCPSGQYWNGASCQTQTSPSQPPSNTTTCPSGQTWNGSSCVTSNTNPPVCPSGQYWNGSSCMAPTEDPATACSKYGGTWTGTTCQKPTTTPAPTPTTTDPATMCAKSGGTWTGTTCQMPTTSPTNPSTSSLQNNFLGAVLHTLGSFFGSLFH